MICSFKNLIKKKIDSYSLDDQKYELGSYTSCLESISVNNSFVASLQMVIRKIKSYFCTIICFDMHLWYYKLSSWPFQYHYRAVSHTCNVTYRLSIIRANILVDYCIPI